jgi:hypothetical protein
MRGQESVEPLLGAGCPVLISPVFGEIGRGFYATIESNAARSG